ncbi:hypothetical protein XELAEV_18027030mg [Xenopus laevis]|uniref:Uncharacterized protein n=1 Tax=Xenopus laevis TaxID=8355 RepID=A0A974CUT8_XENLA|nr:hypothetical protein XELAEV_18027030mg [Xenopus laevis]
MCRTQNRNAFHSCWAKKNIAFIFSLTRKAERAFVCSFIDTGFTLPSLQEAIYTYIYIFVFSSDLVQLLFHK